MKTHSGEYCRYSLSVLAWLSPPSAIRSHIQIHTETHTRMLANKTEHAHSAILHDLECGNIVVSYSPEVKHLCHPHRTAATENSAINMLHALLHPVVSVNTG